MVRFAVLVSSICSLLVLTFVLTRLLAPANCINSTLVGKVIIDAGASTKPAVAAQPGPLNATQIRRCDAFTRLFDAPVPAIAEDSYLIARIENIESLAPYLERSEGPTLLIVRTDNENELSLQPQVIRISANLLMEWGLLEKAVLFSQINYGHILTAEVVSEFLWQEFVEGAIAPEARFWMAHLQTLSQYCRSSGVMLVHRAYCEAQRSLSDSYIADGEESPVPWSLKSLYVQILRSAYTGANLAEKNAMMRNLIFLGDVEDSFLTQNFQRSSLAMKEASFRQSVQDWMMPLLLPEPKVQEALARHTRPNQAEVQHVAIGRSSRELFSPQAITTMFGEHPQQPPLIVQSGMSHHLHPSAVGVVLSRTEAYQEFKVKNSIYISCEMPSAETILEYDGLAPRVLYLKYCQHGDINWSDLARLGFQRYVLNHPEAQFIEFNVAAVKLANRLRGPFEVSTSDKSTFAAWQKWLMWQRTVADDGTNILRPVSAFDGVRRFRF